MSARLCISCDFCGACTCGLSSNDTGSLSVLVDGNSDTLEVAIVTYVVVLSQ